MVYSFFVTFSFISSGRIAEACKTDSSSESQSFETTIQPNSYLLGRDDGLPSGRFFRVNIMALKKDDLIDGVYSRVIKKVIDEIENNRDLDEEGIHRRSGNDAQAKELRRQFENSGDCDLSKDVVPSTHTLVSLLKMYLKSLGSLIWLHISKQIVAALDNDDREPQKRIDAIRDALRSMHMRVRRNLEYICNHLVKVSEHSEKNKMTIENLATLYSATILQTPAMTDPGVIKKYTDAFIFILKHTKEIFAITYHPAPTREAEGHIGQNENFGD